MFRREIQASCFVFTFFVCVCVLALLKVENSVGRHSKLTYFRTDNFLSDYLLTYLLPRQTVSATPHFPVALTYLLTSASGLLRYPDSQNPHPVQE